MNSNSEWEGAQAKWAKESAERHREQSLVSSARRHHLDTMAREEPRYESVPGDDPMPDYDGEDTMFFD